LCSHDSIGDHSFRLATGLLQLTTPRKPHQCSKSSSNTPPTELSTDKMGAWHPGQGTSNGSEAGSESRKSMAFIGFSKSALMYHLLSLMVVTERSSEVKVPPD
jgi:hypothetical protein